MKKNLGDVRDEVEIIEHEMKKSLMDAVSKSDVEVKTDMSIIAGDHKLCSIVNHHKEAVLL